MVCCSRHLVAANARRHLLRPSIPGSSHPGAGGIMVKVPVRMSPAPRSYSHWITRLRFTCLQDHQPE